MDTKLINPWAILVAALCNFAIGGLWYSPALFCRAWMRENGLTAKHLERGSPALIFGASFALALLMAANLAAFLAAPGTDLAWGVTAGILTGLGWVAPALAVIALFERRSWRYTLIHAGYLVTSFAAMGAVLGAWR